MKTVSLGYNGPRVPAIGQGTMGIGGFFESTHDNDAEFVRLLRLGVDLGLSVIDTAEVYADGHAEELVGRAVRDVRGQVTLVTKFSAEHSRAPEVIAAAEGSLRRMATDVIDVYMPHWPNPQVPFAETLQALDSLVRSGKVRQVGLSNFSAADAALAAQYLPPHALACLQNEYSLIERTVEETILPYCAAHSLALMAYSPFGQGKLLVRNARTEALFDMAQRYQASPAQLALAWLLRQASVLAIPKAAREINLRTNAAVLTLDIAATDLEQLSASFRSVVQDIATDQIEVGQAEDGRKVYCTLEQARANAFGMAPSPQELSDEIKSLGGKLQKPIKVRRDPVSGRYHLLEGRIKYWGWVIAYGNARPIPAMVEEATHS